MSSGFKALWAIGSVAIIVAVVSGGVALKFAYDAGKELSEAFKE